MITNNDNSIYQQIGDGEGESFCFCNLTLIHYNLGHYEMALNTSQQALAIHQEIGDHRSEGYTLTYQGHTLADSGQLQLASAAYQKAIQRRRELGADPMIMDNLAGLARIAMKEGHLKQALGYAQEITAWIDANGVEGIEYPLQVYLTCYQILHATANNTPSLLTRAHFILATAYALLQKQAAKIKDETLRHKFLQNVSFNRELMKVWEQKGR